LVKQHQNTVKGGVGKVEMDKGYKQVLMISFCYHPYKKSL
jgi:hypothetical protein